MKKLLFALSCLSISSAFANCDIYIDNYVSFDKTDNGSLNYSKFDVLYERYTQDLIPLKELNNNLYSLNARGDDFDCNTLNYHGSLATTIKLQPYCKTPVDTRTFAKIARGGNLTVDCESGVSLNIKKQYNNLVNLAIVPTGFDNLIIRNLVPVKNESDGLSFIIKNLSLVNSIMNCTQSGKYYNCKPYTQELKLLFDHKLDNAQIEVFSSKHAKIGECKVTRVNNQPLVKCSTLSQYAKNYNIVAKGNTFITVIDPNTDK
ncbi:MAG: hypothetical protein PHC75_07875 [Burkholderiales bacterium]|nr:hypothetical protein [Burkholderiales bacterium]